MLPTVGCQELTGRDFTNLGEGAAAAVSSAALVPGDGASASEYCRVQGFIAPQIGFELRLPTTTYRGRYLQLGCGGYCGAIDPAQQPAVSTGCAPVTAGSLVVGQDDQGHRDTATADVWAADPYLKVDFGYRSEHVFAVVAKAVITAFYGVRPQFSYFDGCSDGGRQALMEAQRYPTDFDGILAGAAALNQTALNAFEDAYLATVDYRRDGSVIVPAAKVDVVHAAAVAACADPGLRDGTIADPRRCRFDPASMACPAGRDEPGCLTAEQVEVVRKIYAGAVAADGTHLYTGGEPVGSEPQWLGLIVPVDGHGLQSTVMYRIATGFLRWVGRWQPDPRQGIDTGLFTVANLRSALDSIGGLYDATNPDLSAFALRGGKLIQWHGWSDGYVPPVGSISYRQALIDTLGQQTVDSFHRLYMFPGMYHCRGGYGPNRVDLLTPLMQWTERDQAPAAVVATKTSTDSNGSAASAAAVPAAGGTVTSSRPVYPYPQRATYGGIGDSTSAAAYSALLPDPIDDHFRWAGGDFRPGTALWCDSDGRQLNCTRRR